MFAPSDYYTPQTSDHNPENTDCSTQGLQTLDAAKSEPHPLDRSLLPKDDTDHILYDRLKQNLANELVPQGTMKSDFNETLAPAGLVTPTWKDDGSLLNVRWVGGWSMADSIKVTELRNTMSAQALKYAYKEDYDPKETQLRSQAAGVDYAQASLNDAHCDGIAATEKPRPLETLRQGFNDRLKTKYGLTEGERPEGLSEYPQYEPSEAWARILNPLVRNGRVDPVTLAGFTFSLELMRLVEEETKARELEDRRS